MLTPNTLFRHVDGGFYRYLTDGRSAENGSAVVIYTHEWPFEQGTWVRDKAEFEDGRFTPVTAAELEAAMQGDRDTYQKQVTASRQARKAAKSS